MQKVFNLLGATAFLMSGAMVAGSLVIYTRIPSITQHYMGELQTELTKIMTDMIPAQLDDVCLNCHQLQDQQSRHLSCRSDKCRKYLRLVWGVLAFQKYQLGEASSRKAFRLSHQSR